MILAIQFTVGICCFVIGLSALFHRRDWLAWLDGLRHEGRGRALVIGMVGLFISALIVGFHPVWSGVAAIVTVLGVLGIIEGAVYLLFPQLFSRIIACFIPHPRFFVVWSALITLIGAVILCEWWSGYHLAGMQAILSAGSV